MVQPAFMLYVVHCDGSMLLQGADMYCFGSLDCIDLVHVHNHRARPALCTLNASASAQPSAFGRLIIDGVLYLRLFGGHVNVAEFSSTGHVHFTVFRVRYGCPWLAWGFFSGVSFFGMC